MPASRKRHISDSSDDESITTGSLSVTPSVVNSSISDPLDTDCRLLMEACQLYASTANSLNDESSLRSDSDSDDDLDEMCLEGDVDFLQKTLTNEGNMQLTESDELELTEEDGAALLRLNQAYQKTIEQKILMIQAKIHYLRSKRVKLRKQVKLTGGHPKKCYIASQRDCCPFFQDSLRRGPEQSEYAKAAMEQCVMINAKRNFKPFSLDSEKEFASAVAKQIRSRLLKEPAKTIERLRRDEDRDDVEYSEALETMEAILNMTESELLSHEDVYSSIDWDEISASDAWTLSPVACYSLWNNLLKPSVNRSKWTLEETKNLLVVSEHLRSWKDIADVLGTGRSPYLCMKRYMEKEPSRDSSRLSASEQGQLVGILERNRIGYHIQWGNVAYELQKKRREILFSLCVAVEDNVKRTRWTESETELLMNAVRDHGFVRINWMEISRFVPGRSPIMCSRRYHVVCNSQLRQRSLLNAVAELYDQVKTAEGSINVDSSLILSSQLRCILNACSFNEVIYKWLRAQRDSVRHFLLTYYKNQHFQGPLKTPNGNLIYPQPIVRLRSNEMSVLSTERARQAIELLLDMKDKGIRPVLPSISNFAKIIHEEKDADAVFERIQDYTTRTESIARQRNLWQLQHFQYTAKYRKDRIEYLHCMAGCCYMRREAPVEAQVSDLIDDAITALVIFSDLQGSDDEGQEGSLKKATKMLGLMQDFLLTGTLAFSSNIRLSDLSQMLMHCIRGETEVIRNPLVLAASYVWSACESAKCCGNSHKMTARYLHPDRRGWPCYRSTFYEDQACPVCPKFSALMHKRLPNKLLDCAKLVNFHIGGYMNEKLKFVGTSIRQHMLSMYHRIALIPMRRAKHQITREVRRAVTEAVIDLVNKVVYSISGPSTRALRKRKKIPKRYKRSFTQRYNIKKLNKSDIVERRCDSEKGAELINRVTKAMNEEGRRPIWLRRQTRLIYSILSAMVIRVEKTVRLTGVKRVHFKNRPETVRRSERLKPPEKSHPWAKISEGRDVPYTRRHYKPRKPTNKKLGRPSNEEKLKRLARRKRLDKQIFLQADFTCGLSQTERFAFCARTLSVDVQALLECSKRFTSHYRRMNAPMTNRMAHCVNMRLSPDAIPCELEVELSNSFKRCLFTILQKDFLNEMTERYISTVNSADAEPVEKQLKRGAQSTTKTLNTRRQLKQSEKLAQANFTSFYWQPAICRNIDVESYSILRHRLRTMFYPAMKQMVLEGKNDPECAEREALLSHAAEAVKTAIQCFNQIHETKQ